MSKLNVDQKIIFDLFSDKKADFLIPDYQRPYAWGEEQCQTLWDDVFLFSTSLALRIVLLSSSVSKTPGKKTKSNINSGITAITYRALTNCALFD